MQHLKTVNSRHDAVMKQGTCQFLKSRVFWHNALLAGCSEQTDGRIPPREFHFHQSRRISFTPVNESWQSCVKSARRNYVCREHVILSRTYTPYPLTPPSGRRYMYSFAENMKTTSQTIVITNPNADITPPTHESWQLWPPLWNKKINK